MRPWRFLPLAALPASLLISPPAGATPLGPQRPATTVAVVERVISPPKVHPVAAPTLRRVTVRPGDTLSAIGATTTRSWTQLAAWNHLPNPDLIYPGQVIVIPPVNYVVKYVPPPTVAQPTVSPRVTETVSPQVTRAAPPPLPETQATAPAPAGGSGVWACIAAHESGGNPGTNTGNGYYGMYQDTPAAWAEGGGLAYASSANQATAAEQTIVNERIQAQQGWGAWPNTSRMCGA